MMDGITVFDHMQHGRVCSDHRQFTQPEFRRRLVRRRRDGAKIPFGRRTDGTYTS